MASNYPNSIDNFDSPINISSLKFPSHAELHTDINAALAAIQSKIGIDESTVQNSLDYRISQLESNPSGGSGLITGANEPENPTNGTLFFDTSSGQLKVYYDVWYVIGGGVSGLEIIDGGSPSTSQFDYTISGGSPSDG